MGRLFWKFFFAFWLVLLIAGTGAGTTVWVLHQNRSGGDPFVAEGGRVFLDLQIASSVLTSGGREALRSLMRQSQGNIPFPVRVMDENGEELLGRPLSPALKAHVLKLAANPARAPFVRRVTLDGGRSLLVFVPLDALPPRRPHPPGGYLSPWMAVLFGLIASIAFSALLAWYVSKPIRYLRSAFGQTAQGRLETRVEPLIGKRSDELGDLCRDFDRMVQRLEAMVAAQRRLFHDVSHELRSPLARIEAAIGLAQQNPHKMGASIDRVAHESGRMAALVGELLTLARLESGATGAISEEIDIDDFIANLLTDARIEAKTKKCCIEFFSETSLTMHGQPELIGRAIENVVRNAIRYSPPQGTLQIKIARDVRAKLIRIEVLDEGLGVEPGDLAAIFEPFFRPQGHPRSICRGYGLGLAIAKRAVEAHGGTIQAENRSGKGLCVRIDLPVNGYTEPHKLPL